MQKMYQKNQRVCRRSLNKIIGRPTRWLMAMALFSAEGDIFEIDWSSYTAVLTAQSGSCSILLLLDFCFNPVA